MPHAFAIRAFQSAAAGALLLSAFAAAGQGMAVSSTTVNGVTVQITPTDTAETSETWRFAVVLDTHSQDLSDDLLAAVELVPDGGAPRRAVDWQGPPPGGHHREGTLAFARPDPVPTGYALRITRAGESQPRVFRWTR